VLRLASARSRVLVAIPAHNEDRYIGSLVLKLRAAGLDVLVVDDGSDDRTPEIAEAAGASVLRHASNLGKTAAMRSAFERAAELRVDALVVIDGDGQHDPGDVEQLLAPILDGRADMVVGSRFAGVASEVPTWRVAGQHILSLATNVGSGLRLADTQSGFRAFSRRAIGEIRLRGTGFSVESEMQFEAKRCGWHITEVPIRVDYDVPLKRNPVWQGIHTLEGIVGLISKHRPLLFFGVPGLVILLAGLSLGAHVVEVYANTLKLAIGMALITIMLCIVGVLSLFTAILLHALRSFRVDLERRR
jgi:glycosyltransferase involved in cell wall biosynthesis